MATTSTKKKNILFSKMESRADALKTIKDSSTMFLVIGIIQGVVGFLLFPSAFIDAVLFIILGLVLMFLQSRIAAILLLLLSGTMVVVTFLNRFGITSDGGTNIFLALLVFWSAMRAVEATFKLYGRFARKPGGFGQEEYIIPEELKRPRPRGFSLDELMESDKPKPRFTTLEWVLMGLAGLLVLGLLGVVFVMF